MPWRRDPRAFADHQGIVHHTMEWYDGITGERDDVDPVFLCWRDLLCSMHDMKATDQPVTCLLCLSAGAQGLGV